jgi:hypothetical protein
MWTPYKPNPEKPPEDEEWSGVHTDQVKSGFYKWVQDFGLVDVAAENKFLIRLLNDFNPPESGALPRGSTANEANAKLSGGNAKKDLALCFGRNAGKSGTGDARGKCSCQKSACLKNVVCRYFSFVKIRTAAIAKRSADKKTQENALDFASFGLDIAGMLPEPAGPIFDVVNAAIQFGRGKNIDGAMSVL